jgi:MFS family permease
MALTALSRRSMSAFRPPCPSWRTQWRPETLPAGPARARALGAYGAMGGLGSVVGLLLGGALTEYLSWRWVLFINVPIAALVLIGTGGLVPGDNERGALDVAGAATATRNTGLEARLGC